MATLFALALSSRNTLAEPLRIGLEPIIGYEHVQKVVPTPHSKNRLVYGARLTAGVLLLSLEAEYTRGTDKESFSDQSLETTDQADRLKLGLRSGFRLSRIMSMFFRGGVQASRNKHTETLSGVTTTAFENTKYKPYAGTGFSFGLSRNLSFSSGVVVVFNDMNNMKKNEYQTTAGFTIRFP